MSALCYWLLSFYEDTRAADRTAPLQFLVDLLFMSVFAVDLYIRYQVRWHTTVLLIAWLSIVDWLID